MALLVKSLQGLAYASVKSRNGLAVASIKSINGLDATSAGVLLLDESGLTGATGAWSLRKLRAAYAGSCIRVRRSSDSTEQDIGFTGNELDTASLLTFTGAGNGFVVTWYDQSSNARNITQATTANQPQIVASGAVITGSGSKPAMQFDGSNDGLATTEDISSFIASGARTVWVVFNATAITGTGLAYNNDCLWRDSGSYTGAFLNATELQHYNYDGANKTAVAGVSTATWYIGENRHESGTLAASVNGGTEGTDASGATQTTTNDLQVGIGNIYFNGKMHELVFFNTALSSGVRTTGRTNINAQYAIF